MAAAAAAQVKQLRQILQEQQEPFILKTYLAEKGCCVRNKHNNSLEAEEGSFTCCRVTSGNKGQKGVSNLSKVVRNLYDHVGSINGKKLRSKKKKKQRQSSEAEAEERLAIASCCSSKDFNWYSSESDNAEGRASCSSSFADFWDSNEEKIAADGSLQWRCMEGGGGDQQFSPVSVLEGLASREDDDDSSSPPTNNSSTGDGIIIRRKKKEEEKQRQVSADESIIASASVWGVLLRRAEANETGDPLKSTSRDALELEKTKKQLLFDCILEEMELETHHKQCCTSSSEKIVRSWAAWSKRWKAGDESELLSDSLGQREWSENGEQPREIGLEIGGAIAEAIMDEIMVDLIGISSL
ncbi:unnamed protein product [Linum trigynum]|uniref:DUF4378 domain-containing protein n=1 Tax=Linum trigynum TaxID=586398 RepID=A0AAV2D0S9_9ROSI